MLLADVANICRPLVGVIDLGPNLQVGRPEVVAVSCAALAERLRDLRTEHRWAQTADAPELHLVGVGLPRSA